MFGNFFGTASPAVAPVTSVDEHAEAVEALDAEGIAGVSRG